MTIGLTLGKKIIWRDPSGKRGEVSARILEWLSPSVALIQLDATGHTMAVNTSDLREDA